MFISVMFRCNNARDCEIRAASDNFGGDPCPGTGKYLEVMDLHFIYMGHILVRFLKITPIKGTASINICFGHSFSLKFLFVKITELL